MRSVLSLRRMLLGDIRFDREAFSTGKNKLWMLEMKRKKKENASFKCDSKNEAFCMKLCDIAKGKKKKIWHVVYAKIERIYQLQPSHPRPFPKEKTAKSKEPGGDGGWGATRTGSVSLLCVLSFGLFFHARLRQFFLPLNFFRKNISHSTSPQRTIRGRRPSRPNSTG